MFGQGLIKGLQVTWHLAFGKAITEQYPERRPNLPPRSHGSFVLESDKCRGCEVCANACPNHVISVQTRRGEDKKRHLSKFTMKLGQCLFCGLCVESCPSDALHFKTDFELACYRFEDTIHVLFEDKGGASKQEVDEK
ncbi:4Fe-4S dicluster domain-containing protein [Thermanaeromonas sp. C210]|uniref:4Fe-4S dicluster domain-containing protein n=1 Tax=Thermanaeromonas sp. C210 TaxID=2731925 RepID=UPI00155D2AC4|nr:4Fe-4S dicluster domain-containing protein [Thermanaeromonas sp. C210]GFN23947.1 4Fe-4S ferredoxin [Thermanaeromonas sp. C210]